MMNARFWISTILWHFIQPYIFNCHSIVPCSTTRSQFLGSVVNATQAIWICAAVNVCALTNLLHGVEKLTGPQLVKKLPACYGTQRFIITFTSAFHLSLSWARSTQSMPPHPTSWRSRSQSTRDMSTIVPHREHPPSELERPSGIL